MIKLNSPISTLGFTLIEVLLALTILATLMAFTAQTVLRSSRDKVKLQGEIDRDSRLTNALRLIERDINMAFHNRQFLSEVEKQVKKDSQSTPPTNTTGGTAGGTQPGTAGQDPNKPPTQPGFDFQPKDSPQLTQFMGTENSINFTSLSHVRTIKDSQESDQQEVGYYIETCENKKEGEDSTQCMWRRSTPYIDDDVTKGGGAVLLLPGVKSLKFRFYSEDKADWVSTWRTDQGGDDTTRDKFPLAVEITLAVEEKGKESSVSAVIPLLFPNNPDKNNNATTQVPATTNANPPNNQQGTTK